MGGKLRNGPSFCRSGCSKGTLNTGYWWVEGETKMYKKFGGILRNGNSVCMP